MNKYNIIIPSELVLYYLIEYYILLDKANDWNTNGKAYTPEPK